MKKQNLFKLTSVALSALLFTSCGVMYTPSMQNVPLIQEKNELRATIGITDFQGAYSVTDNVAVMLNGYYNNGAGSIFNEDYYSWDRQERTAGHVEAGAGLFKKLNDNTIVEVYGGFGMGNNSLKNYRNDTSNVIPTLNSSFKATNTRFFLQPSCGYTIENFDVAFSTRILFQKYSNAKATGYTTEDLYSDKLLNIEDPIFVFLEPAITMRFGYKYVKFHAQAILSYKYNIDRLNYMPFVFNVGIHVNLADRLFKMNAKPKSAPSLDED